MNEQKQLGWPASVKPGMQEAPENSVLQFLLGKVPAKHLSQPEVESPPSCAVGMGLSDDVIQASDFTDETQTSDLPKVTQQSISALSKGHLSSFSYGNFPLNTQLQVLLTCGDLMSSSLIIIFVCARQASVIRVKYVVSQDLQYVGQ